MFDKTYILIVIINNSRISFNDNDLYFVISAA